MSRLSSECLLWQRLKYLYLINLIQLYLSKSNFFLWATHFLIVSGEKQAHSEVLHLICVGWLSWDNMNYPAEGLRQINPTLFVYFKKFPLISVAVRSAQYFIKMLQTKGARDLREIIWAMSMLLLPIRPQKLKSQHTKKSMSDHLCEVCSKQLCGSHPAAVGRGRA